MKYCSKSILEIEQEAVPEGGEIKYVWRSSLRHKKNYKNAKATR